MGTVTGDKITLDLRSAALLLSVILSIGGIFSGVTVWATVPHQIEDHERRIRTLEVESRENAERLARIETNTETLIRYINKQ